MGWLIVSFTALCMASCGANGGPTVPRNVNLGEPFDLGAAQMAVVGDTGLTVTFDRVAADSRCPVDVQCIWEGDATVVLGVLRIEGDDSIVSGIALRRPPVAWSPGVATPLLVVVGNQNTIASASVDGSIAFHGSGNHAAETRVAGSLIGVKTISSTLPGESLSQ